MAQPFLALARRTRATPFSNRVFASGVSVMSVYNRMMLPAVFKSPEEDYYHLKSKVQVWDVSCERQVEIVGPDAARLTQYLTPRSLEKLKTGMCYYTPMTDQHGGMLNDPVTLKLAEDRFRVSIADSDLLLWVKGIAFGKALDVEVFEPDVSPLAIQGPLSDELAARVFGDEVRSLRFFRFMEISFAGKTHLMSRSGFSKQGGFEIYLEGSENGEALWDALFEAGQDLDVRAGCPNTPERIESGLLSYGNDMTMENTPMECGFEKFCHPDRVHDFIGRDALMRKMEAGPERQIKGILIESDGPMAPLKSAWELKDGNHFAGIATSSAYSPGLQSQIAIAMIEKDFWEAGQTLTLTAENNSFPARVTELPFAL